MKTRTKTSVFSKTFLAVSPLRLPFCSTQLFCILWFSKQKLTTAKNRFDWRTFWIVSPENMAQNWRHSFVWVLFYCNFYVIRYYHLTDNCHKAGNIKQNLVFPFLLYILIYLSIYLYISIIYLQLDIYNIYIYHIYYIYIIIYISYILYIYIIYTLNIYYIYCIYIYIIYIYITNKGINNQLQAKWSMTNAYMSKL